MHETKHTPALTGLRGLAAAWVFAFHLWQACGRPALPLLGIDLSPLLAGGHYGVDLFFVLSGFLLARPFIAARLQALPPPPWGEFLVRRGNRVLPAYWAQLLVLVLVAGIGTFDARDLAMHATLTFNVVDNGSRINPVYWTLPVEWDFYLLLPLLALGLPRAGARPWLLAGLMVFAFGFRVWCWRALFLPEPDVAVFRWIIQLPARIDQFAIGMAVAWWLAARPLPGAGWRSAAASAGLALLGAVAWITVAHGDELTAARLPWAYWQAPLAALGCAGLILAAATPGDGLNRLWRSVPMTWLGTISYSLYLWHYPVLGWLTGRGLAGGTLVAAAIAAALPVAWLSWRLFERPFVRRRAIASEAQ